MIEWTNDQITTAKELIVKRLEKHEFSTRPSTLIPASTTDEELKPILDMFLCIGMNSSGQTVTANNAMTFIKKGINRFFLSLKNRRDLSADMFKKNEFKGKYNIACDYYVGPAVFYAEFIPDRIIDRWNQWMRPLKIKGRYGVQVIKITEDGKSNDHVKYRWITRYTK